MDQQRNQDVQVNVKEVPFSEVEGWYQGKDGSLHHDSGKFFSIEGIQVETTMDGVRLDTTYYQPAGGGVSWHYSQGIQRNTLLPDAIFQGSCNYR